MVEFKEMAEAIERIREIGNNANLDIACKRCAKTDCEDCELMFLPPKYE